MKLWCSVSVRASEDYKVIGAYSPHDISPRKSIFSDDEHALRHTGRASWTSRILWSLALLEYMESLQREITGNGGITAGEDQRKN